MKDLTPSTGFYTGLSVSILGIISLLIGFFTPPLSGPWCLTNPIIYPYTAIAERFPRDYLWMFPAMLLTMGYLFLLTCVHGQAPKKRRLFSFAAIGFGTIASAALIINYFVQISVIQPSVLNKELAGISILTQYNPHGIFIVIEEIGYLLMSVSLLCLVPVFTNKNKIDKTLQITFVSGFILTVLSLVLLTIKFGIWREYRFEVAAISINWLMLIVGGFFLALRFRKSE